MNFIPRPPSGGGNFPKTYRREKMEEYHIEVIRDTKKGNNAWGERYENNDYVLFYDKKEKKKYTLTKDLLAYFCKVLIKKWNGGFSEELPHIKVDTLACIEYLEDKIEELAYYGDSQHIDERQHLQMILKLLIMNAD